MCRRLFDKQSCRKIMILIRQALRKRLPFEWHTHMTKFLTVFRLSLMWQMDVSWRDFSISPIGKTCWNDVSKVKESEWRTTKSKSTPLFFPIHLTWVYKDKAQHIDSNITARELPLSMFFSTGFVWGIFRKWNEYRRRFNFFYRYRRSIVSHNFAILPVNVFDKHQCPQFTISILTSI